MTRPPSGQRKESRIMPPAKRVPSKYNTSFSNRNVKEALDKLDYRMVEKTEWQNINNKQVNMTA